MKQLIFLLFTLSAGWVAAQSSQSGYEKLHPERTVVAGRLKNLRPADGRVVTVNYCDPLDNKDKVAREVSPDGTFHTSYPMCFSQNITVNYGGRFINLFVHPSDSVFIEIDMDRYRSGGFDGVIASGSNAGINNLLPAFYDYMCRLPIPKFDLTLPPDEFVSQLKGFLKQAQDSIDRYAREKGLPPSLAEWGKRDVKYAYANYILDYGEDDLQARYKVFTDPLFDLYDPAGFQSMMFPYHLSAVARTIVQKTPEIMAAARAQDAGMALEAGLKEFLKLPPSLARDYMLYSFLEQISKLQPGVADNLPEGVFSDVYFLQKLREKAAPPVAEYKGEPLKGVSYLAEGNKVQEVPRADVIAYLAAKYPGKVLYIDVYATWCGPCRAEFAPAKELHKLFVGKDAVFVNLCLSSDTDKWIETVKQMDIEGENYYFDADATGLFMSAYGLSGYPSYMLVDKSGKVVTNKAPRPSNITSAAGAINALLK